MTSQKYLLPLSIDDSRLDLILEIFAKIRSGREEIYLDFQKTKNISAAGLAILCCLSDSAREAHTKLESINYSHLHCKEFLTTILNSSGYEGFINIENFKYEGDNILVEALENTIAPWFLDKVDQKFEKTITEENLWNARLILNELMQNAKDHSTSERYFIFAGAYSDHFQIGVCDMGVTIPAKLSQKYICENDSSYLIKSLEFKVGTRRTRPGGLGLNHMFEILKSNQGRLVILSRDAQLRRYFKTRKTDSSKLKYTLNGTWCMGRLPRKEHCK